MRGIGCYYTRWRSKWATQTNVSDMAITNSITLPTQEKDKNPFGMRKLNGIVCDIEICGCCCCCFFRVREYPAIFFPFCSFVPREKCIEFHRELTERHILEWSDDWRATGSHTSFTKRELKICVGCGFLFVHFFRKKSERRQIWRIFAIFSWIVKLRTNFGGSHFFVNLNEKNTLHLQ